MCGIVGLFTNPYIQFDTDKAIRNMARAITHRGPDQDGFFVDHHVALGMRRLSIIDLASGEQPIWSADGTTCIFFNGEIYNYLELKEELVAKGYHFKTKTDTEVILVMYMVHGKSMVSRLRGMFTFCIYNTISNTAFIARDPFGIKPLYYWQKEGHIIAFASEIKALYPLNGFEKRVNDEAIYHYLSFQYNPLPETFFKGVYTLAPGHSMTVDLGKDTHHIEQYTDFTFDQKDLTEAEAVSQTKQAVVDSVTHHMIADVPVGSFLSGGVDSSIIGSTMQHIHHEPINTFTVGFEGFSEGEEAKETADMIHSHHHDFVVSKEMYITSLPQVIWHFDEPVGDPSAVGLFFLAKKAREKVKVVLSGEGADELFGGYNIYREPLIRRYFSWVPRVFLKLAVALPFRIRGKELAHRILSGLDRWYIGNASVFKEGEVEALWKGKKYERFSLAHLYTKVKHLSESTQMQYIDIHTWLIGDILAKADKMTMAHSLELRVPFLDMEVARISKALPDELKWKNGMTKYVLRKAFQGDIPDTTNRRKKLGFPVPLATWLRDPQSPLYAHIRHNTFLEQYIDQQAIDRLIAEHTQGHRDHARKLYLLIMLSLWYTVCVQENHGN